MMQEAEKGKFVDVFTKPGMFKESSKMTIVEGPIGLATFEGSPLEFPPSCKSQSNMSAIDESPFHIHVHN
jgi:hypothetical protein